MTPEERCALALKVLEHRGVVPFDDLGWMDPAHKGAVCAPFAAALRAAVKEESARCARIVRGALADYEQGEHTDEGASFAFRAALGGIEQESP